MYVRTDPRTNSRVAVTFDLAEVIDDEWAKINGTWPERLQQREGINSVRSELREQFEGQEPSELDIQWRILCQDSV